MAANKRKILEAARKHAQKGSKDRAIKEYEKLIALDPRDAKLRLEIGDAHRRWGQVDEAIAAYTKVAEQYTKEGFDARAVAVYKQIQNLDPDRYQTYTPLAELYQRMGLMSEAINALQTAADGYHKDGNKREALELLRKMASIDPTNTSSRIKVADLLRQEGLEEEAVAEYAEAIDELVRQGEHEAASGVYERILEMEPDRLEALVPLAQLLLQQGAADRAEPYAKRALAIDSNAPEHFELLAKIYGALAREEELEGVYRRLADLYVQRGDEDRAREIRQRFVTPDAVTASTSGAEGLDDATAFDPGPLAREDREPELLTEELLEEELLEDEVIGDGPPALETDSGIFEEDLTVVAPRRPPRATDPEPIEITRPLIPESPPAVDPDADPEQLLAEASVYLRYGKRDQAVANLEAILAREARHRTALEKLGEAYAEGGESSRAVEQWLRAAEIAGEEGDDDARIVLRDRIAALDESAAAAIVIDPAPDELEIDLDEPASPGAEAEATVLQGLGDPGEETSGAAAEDAEADTTGSGDEDFGEIEIDIDEESFRELPEESQPEGRSLGEVALDTADFDSESGSVSLSGQINEDLEEAEFYTQQGLTDEAEAIYRRLQSLAPNHPLIQVRLGEIAAARGEDPGDSGRLEAAAGTAGDEVDDATPAADGGVDLEAWHAEGDEELLPEGGEVVRSGDAVERAEEPVAIEPPASEALAGDSLGDSLGESEDLDLGLGEDEDDETPAPLADDGGAADAAQGEPDGEGFDLAAELSDAFEDDASGRSGTFGDSADDFAAVFREFKKGVSETLSEGDQQAHYDLGIAYREMGLYADAIGEFESASQSAELRVDCLHLMGLCALDQDDASRAVGYLDQALATPGVTDEQLLAARFALGRAHEFLGEVAKARELYGAVAEVDASFCEVGERLEALDEPEKSDEPPTGEFECFDDVMSEVDAGGDPDEDTLSGADASGAGSDAAPETFEDFTDLMSDDEGPGDAPPPTAEPAVGAADEPRPDTDELRPDTDEPAAPEPATPEPAAEAPDEAPRRRRKKKISFV